MSSSIRKGIAKTVSKPVGSERVDKALNTIGKQNRRRVARALLVKADQELEPNNRPTSLANSTGETANQGLIDSPYDLATLAQLKESSDALGSFVDAYKTNIAGFGWGLRYNFDITSEDIDKSIKDKAKEEWDVLELFYKYCNFDKSFHEIMKQVIDDKETIGFGILEVLFDQSGTPCGFEHIPAQTIQIGEKNEEVQEVSINAVTSSGESKTITFQKQFRTFRQEVDNTQVWFKEFGDPRFINRETGEFFEEGHKLTEEEEYGGAVIMFSNSVPYSVYGVPRWIGNFLNIQGSRRAEELNFRYFSNGRHTPLAIIVNNGTLTESSMETIQGYVDNVEGVEHAFGYLVLEAEGFDEDEDPTSSNTTKTSIEVKPLTEALLQDALFQNYKKDNKDSLRQSMRLAPIYTGASADYTRATADVARVLTEEQVFQPEREAYQDRINRLINQALDIHYVEMYFKGPNITNQTELSAAIANYSKTGAVIPNHVINGLSRLLGVELEEIKDLWANLPKDITLELIKQGNLDILGLTANNGNVDSTDGETGTGDEGGTEDNNEDGAE